MTALLLLAHGSPRASANAALERLAVRMRERVAFGHVEIGYLECNEPSIPESIDLCATAGATEIVAVPWFLHIGTHVAQDLPDFLREGQGRHPGVVIRLADYVGLAPLVSDLLADRAEVAAQASE